MNCSKCGAQIPDGSRFCEKCGYKIEQEVEQEVAGKAVIDAERDKVAEPEPAPAAKKDAGSGEIKEFKIHDREKPLSVLSYMITLLLLLVPFLGLFLVLVWSFSSRTNVNRQNFARAILVLLIIGIVIVVVMGFFLQSTVMPMFEDFQF